MIRDDERASIARRPRESEPSDAPARAHRREAPASAPQVPDIGVLPLVFLHSLAELASALGRLAISLHVAGPALTSRPGPRADAGASGDAQHRP